MKIYIYTYIIDPKKQKNVLQNKFFSHVNIKFVHAYIIEKYMLQFVCKFDYTGC